MTIRTIAAFLATLLTTWAAPGAAQQFYVPQEPEEPEVAIISPAHDEMVHNNLGSVVVNLAVRELEEYEEVVLLLDEQEVARDHALPSFIVLNDLNRGTHQLQVLIVDGDGEVVAESPVSTFYIWKASRLQRAGARAPGGAV